MLCPTGLTTRRRRRPSRAVAVLDRRIGKLACELRLTSYFVGRGCAADRNQRPQDHVHDDDMAPAFDHPVLVDELDDGFTMFIGADRAGSLLEIGVIDTTDGPIIVHAMPARPKYLR